MEITLSKYIALQTAGTYLLSEGATIEQTAKWLGHTSSRTTQIYAKITQDYLSELADKIDKKN